MIEGLGGVTGLPIGYPQQSALREDAPQKIDKVEEELGRDFQDPSEKGEKSGEFNKGQAEQAIEKLNQTMETYNTELRFKLHEKSGEYIVKIVNPKDQSVIREIPPERVLNMVAYFKKVLGLVVDKFA
ncbi:flagellar protein FlaG [Desulfotomaculum sp. 1211_IL3151]|uniref:flagellar protein FlaG n=1 Tax=Desulfotomaculum sp. 1211_IL3151 TaxID=3084055 RepID=UPI002FD9D49D